MKKQLSILFVLVYAFSAFAGNGLVLCDNGKGHKEIETVHENETHCSDHEYVHSNDGKKSLSIHNEKCGPCEDTALLTDQTIRLESLTLKIYSQTAIDPINRVLNHGTFPCFEQSIYSKPPPRLNSTLTFLRTIILII
jgi:hypothetical protein